MKILLVLAFCSLLAGPAFAVDGVVLINQSIALAGGVTPGDTPGFPVTISVSGSYRLSGNLVVPDANTTGIQVTADNVTIDLNGFSIMGPESCTGQPVTSCSPIAAGNFHAGIGIDSESQTNTSLSISNGTITGMGSMGIRVAGGARVDNVHASNNGAFGLQVFGTGMAAAISSTVANSNGFMGISTTGSIIGCEASFNQSNGFLAGALIVNSTAMFNGGNGILAGGEFATLVSGNTAILNTGAGISADCPANIVGNMANNNTGGEIVTNGSSCTRANNNPQP